MLASLFAHALPRTTIEAAVRARAFALAALGALASRFRADAVQIILQLDKRYPNLPPPQRLRVLQLVAEFLAANF